VPVSRRAAGVIWAQVYLAEQGAAETRAWSLLRGALVERYRDHVPVC